MIETTSTSKFTIEKRHIIFGLFTSLFSGVPPVVYKALGTNLGPILYSFFSSMNLQDLYGLISGIITFFYYGFFAPFFMIVELVGPSAIGFVFATLVHMLFWFFFGTTIAYLSKKTLFSIGCLLFLFIPINLFVIATLIFLSGPDPVMP